MAIKKFNVKVVVEKEYEISIDDEKYNEKFFEDYSIVFHTIDCLEDVVKDLASYQAKYGTEDTFIEGYGHVPRDYKIPRKGILIGEDLKTIIKGTELKTLAQGLNIQLVDDEDYFDFTITKIN